MPTDDAAERADGRVPRREQVVRRESGAEGHFAQRRAQRGRRGHRAQRLRQDDAAALRQPARGIRGRRNRRRRRDDRISDRGRMASACAAASGRSPRRGPKIGFVFQSFNLFPHMTVLRNVAVAPIRVNEGAAARPPRPLPAICLRASVSPTRRMPIPAICPAASSSEWPSRGRWRCSPS